MLALMLLWIVPILAFALARRSGGLHIWRLTGMAFGLVVSPASLGLYSLFAAGPILGIFGMLGFVLVLIHSAPGYHLGVGFRLVPPHCIVDGFAQHVTIEILNGVVWGTVYAAVGWAVDQWLRKRA
jgi:hypothetical protein